MSHDAELQLLRDFYASWVNMHTIARDGLHRKQQEEAAQVLVNNGHALKLFYKGTRSALEKLRIALVNQCDCHDEESGIGIGGGW